MYIRSPLSPSLSPITPILNNTTKKLVELLSSKIVVLALSILAIGYITFKVLSYFNIINIKSIPHKISKIFNKYFYGLINNYSLNCIWLQFFCQIQQYYRNTLIGNSTNIYASTVTPNVVTALLQYHDQQQKGAVGGVYMTTNELGVCATKQQLQQINHPSDKNTCHIGFSGWHNFDIMVITQPDLALICDFNPNNKVFIDSTLSLLIDTDNRHDFIDKMEEKLTQFHTSQTNNFFSIDIKNNTDIEDQSNIEWLHPLYTFRQEQRRQGSWLASEQSFTAIQELAKTRKIVAISLDITDTARCQQLSTTLKTHNFVVSSCYLSNIAFYVGKKNKYIASVNALTSNDTVIIDCPYSSTEPQRIKACEEDNISSEYSNLPLQRVCSGAELRSTKTYFKYT